MRSRVLLLLMIVALAALAALVLGRAVAEDPATYAAPATTTSTTAGPGEPAVAPQRPRVRVRAVESLGANECALTVRVETTAGTPLEGVVVWVDGTRETRDRPATDDAGRAALGAVARGARVTALLSCVGGHTDPLALPVDVPAEAAEHEAVLRVDPPLVPVLVVRLRPDAPRRRVLRLAWWSGGDLQQRDVAAELTTVRIPLPPPRPAALRMTAACPGFLPAETEIRIPQRPGDFAVELPLRSGGVPAWGRVVDGDGTPAADVEVLACEGRAPDDRALRTRSDGAGRFAIELAMLGRSLVALRRAVACSPWLDLTPDVHAVELHLGEGASVEGTVRLSDRSPAAGALVRVRFARTHADCHDLDVPTDAAGRYRAAGIPEGWWFRPVLMFARSHGPLQDDASPFATGTPEEFVARGVAHVARGPGDVFRRDLVARRYVSGAYAIRLRFPRGTDVPGSVTEETRTESGCSTREETIDAADPVVTGELSPGERVRICIRAGQLQGETGWFVTEQGKPRHLVVEMRTATRLVAQLVDAAGAPVRLAGVDVLVGDWHGDSGSGSGPAATDGEGRADLTGCVPMAWILDDPRRVFTFATRGRGVLYRMELGEQPNLRVPGPELARRLREASDVVVLPIAFLPPRRLVVRAVDASGTPLVGVALQTGPEAAVAPESVTTDAEGRAELDVLVEPAESHAVLTLTALAPHVGSATCRLQELDLGTPWTLEVLRLVRQRVRFVDDGGAPVVGAALARDPVHATDAAGEADVLLRPAEDNQVELQGYEPATVVPCADGATLRVAVRALHAATIDVVLPSGAPDAYRVVVSNGTSVEERTMRSNGGRTAWVTLRLPGVAHTVELVSEDRLWGAQVVLAPGAESATVTMARRPLHLVRVRFTGPSGAPAARTAIAIEVKDAPFFPPREMTTDASGEIVLELPHGGYGLVHVRADGTKSNACLLSVPSEGAVVVAR